MNTRRLLPLFALAVCLAAPRSAAAQPSDLRIQVGGQVSGLHSGEVGLAGDTSSVPGFGGRLSYDVARWFAIEGEVSFFPSDTLAFENTFGGSEMRMSYRRQRLEAFFGPKIGLRMERFGVFGKVRPGVSRLSGKGHGVDCVGERCAYVNSITPTYEPEFALDLGAVLEFYPSATTVARVDLGDTMVRHNSMAPPCRGCTTHNFSPRVGFAVRF